MKSWREPFIGKLVRPLKEVQGRNGPITFADMVIEAPGETFDGVEAGMLCSVCAPSLL